MPTANERKALWFLALVAISGTVVRLWRSPGAVPATADAALYRQIQRVDSVRSRPHPDAIKTRSPRAARQSPRAPDLPIVTGPVDLDRAALSEIQGIPGMPPWLATRIVSNRDSLGAFGSLNALCWRVRGVGPATAERLRPMVTFSAASSPLSGECGAPSKATRKERRGSHRPSR